MGRRTACVVAVCLAACASKRDEAPDLAGFGMLREALRTGDAPAVFGLLAPHARDEWRAAHRGGDDPLDRWARYLRDPATRWRELADAEVVDARRPVADTTDVTLRLADGFVGTLRLRRTADGWFVLPAPMDSPDAPLHPVPGAP